MAMVIRNPSIICSCGIRTRGRAAGGIPVVKSQWRSLGCSGSAPPRLGASRREHGPDLGRRECAGMVVMARSSGSGRKSKQQDEKRSRENMRPAYPPPPPTSTSKPVEIGKEDMDVEESGGAEAAPDDIEASTSGLAESQSGKDKIEATRNSGTEPPEDIRMASELRKASAVLRSQDPALTTDFWKGVIEETKLIEWPAFSRILGTTRTVVAMIVGSSVVLLTVNAVLAATSEYLLNDQGFRNFVKTYLNLAI